MRLGWTAPGRGAQKKSNIITGRTNIIVRTASVGLLETSKTESGARHLHWSRQRTEGIALVLFVELEFALQEKHVAIERLIKRMLEQNQFVDIESVCVICDDPNRYEGALRKYGIKLTKPAAAEEVKVVENFQKKFRKDLSDSIYETESDGHRVLRTDNAEMVDLFEKAVRNAKSSIFSRLELLFQNIYVFEYSTVSIP
eukprot:Nk52_evm105s226 gene=Nk52_evmTU105s226